MTLLAACPGGNILEPAVAEVADTNLVPFADELVSGLTGPQNDVFHHDARFKMLAAGRRFGKTHLSLVQLIVWAALKSGSLNWYIAPTYERQKALLGGSSRRWSRRNYLPTRTRLTYQLS